MAFLSSAPNMNDKAVIVDLNVISKDGIEAKHFRISCSGTFIDYSRGLIITNGLIFTPFLQVSNNYDNDDVANESWSKLHEYLSNSTNSHIKESNNNESRSFLDYIDSLCEILVYVQTEHNGNHVSSMCDRNRLKNPLVALAKAAKRERTTRRASSNDNRPSWRIETARILALWRFEPLNRVLDSVLSQTNSWSFVDVQDAASAVSNTGAVRHQEEQARTLLPFFVLLKIPPIDDKRPEQISVDQNDPYATIDRLITSAIDSIDQNFLLSCFKSIAAASQKCIRYFSSSSSDQLQTIRLKEVAATIDDEGRLERDEIVRVLSEVCENSPRAIIGSKLSLVSTPFGSLSPSVFLNSVSSGILTNVAGEDGALIMTDARCVPGCEGGALYVETGHKLLGIIVAPFCWRQNEWVGLTFACSLRPLLLSFLETITEPSILNKSLARLSDGRVGSELAESVALVKIGSRWGSAVVVDLGRSTFSNELILLTCCHVVQKQTGSAVRVRFMTRGSAERFHVDAVVLYATPPGQVYDVAVLRADASDLGYVPRGLQLSSKFVSEGAEVRVVGHGLFDDYVGLPASVTSGVISKVLYKDRKQVLIQSSCAVHPGASGGALVNVETNQLSGIVVCNARDAVSGACYPHINLSIPSTILQPVLQHFRKHRDITVFDKLYDPDPTVNSYWQLGFNRLDKINSKL